MTADSGGINDGTSFSAGAPSLASIGGVPHVAWTEPDGTNNELRVARLNTTNNTWGQPWTGVTDTDGKINASTTEDAFSPSLVAFGTTPFVAWTELDGTNTEIRVARLANLTPTWEEPWAGVSTTSGGINQSTALDADGPSLAVIGGLLHVAWREDDGTNRELRVARLNANAWSQPWNGVSATYGGINQAGEASASEPSLASIGGVPHLSLQMAPTRTPRSAWRA